MCVQPLLGVLCVPPGVRGALLASDMHVVTEVCRTGRSNTQTLRKQLQGTQYVCECEYKYSKMNFKKKI